MEDLHANGNGVKQRKRRDKNVTNDGNEQPVPEETVADILEQHGLTYNPKTIEYKESELDFTQGWIKALTNNFRLIGLICITCYFFYQIKIHGFHKTLSFYDTAEHVHQDVVTDDPQKNLVNPTEPKGDLNYFLATTEQHIEDISFYEVNCSKTGYWREKQYNTDPKKCGVLVTDEVVTPSEAKRLRKIVERLINSIGDASTKVRESLNLQWINFHNIFRRADHLLQGKDFELVKKVGEICRGIIAETFEIDHDKLLYFNVTQMTRYRHLTRYEEFRHVDKARSLQIVVTSILWLSTVGEEFDGGETEFLIGGPKPYTPVLIEPKRGRFAAWTSSYENPHGVFEVTRGERYALIFGFTSLPYAGWATLDDLRSWSIDPKNAPSTTSKAIYFINY